MPGSAPRVIAIVAAFNEEDVIGDCLAHLHGQGIDTYLLDDGSTDRTPVIAREFAGRGLIGMEQLPAANGGVFSLRRILERKEALARTLPASWFINQDADEFRDSLWAECTLREAIGRVDRLGYNAIDFQIFTIRPVAGRSATVHPTDPGGHYSRGSLHDERQVRAWKRTGAAIDLCSSGGHDVTFTGRRVFPLRFPMRHYPIRSQAHGQRKLFAERLPRYAPEERGLGWHVHYADLHPGALLAADPADVQEYDPGMARALAALSNRELDEVRDSLAHARSDVERSALEIAAIRRDQQALEGARDRLADAVDLLQRELTAVYASKSWRWSRPFRALWRLGRSRR